MTQAHLPVKATEAMKSALLPMLGCVTLLAFMGLAAGVSAAPPGEAWAKMGIHCLHLAIGLGAFLVLFSAPVEGFRKIVPGLCFLVWLVLLGMKLIPGFGHESHGATRWVSVGPMLLQPSVFLQCLWPALLASWISKDPLRMSQPRELWRLMFLFAALMLPVLLQPDFGSILILAGATGMVLFFSGAPLNFLRQLIPLLLIALVLMLFLFDHVDARLASFFGGETGYQAQHAEEAFAAGGLTGVGPGLGVMKNGHVPEGDTDYILALIAEEWGLVGTGLVWALFVCFTLFGLRAARRAECRYGAILMAAAVLMVSMQAALNMAVVTGLVPPKGLPLPFVSRGGSSIISLSALLGLAVRAALERRRSKVPVSELIQWTESNALA
ncbi:MAG TPA: FtsW/RodA/SpoVE family cell cycle protein [Planctomycetota bacterium]|nr:hypothetical protein [Planctomycetota bacterium]MDP7246102.1 FtsW/RodA/SpoVE family cell cycle protein [Planctomycetota bacterium]HJM39807.1 FtsW/RodA/SpoVE family cell cycle protein [Planctomycetota bacterium]|tara:strand:- start:28625 stop:29773 length:1149 start_codon:yes stop_codon:yes gene_type:complete